MVHIKKEHILHQKVQKHLNLTMPSGDPADKGDSSTWGLVRVSLGFGQEGLHSFFFGNKSQIYKIQQFLRLF